MAAAELKRQTATVDCPKSMVGRVIGKNGETIKALQTYTGALIQIDQTVEPTKVTISGTPHSLSLAVSMVTDIVKGTFKGFALLRQITNAGVRPAGVPPAPMAQPRPVYAPGYGLIPPSQLYGADDRTAGVIAVGRQPGAMPWPQGGPVAPSQVILGLPQPGGMMRPMGAQQAMLAGGMGAMGGMDDGMMQMGGYGVAAPMYAAYQPAEYGMPGVPGVGLMGGPGADMMYGAMDGSMMGGGPVGAQARMYGAAASPKPGGGLGMGRGGGVPKSGSSSELCDTLGGGGTGAGGGGSNWVQIMDPEGKVYLVNQAHGQ